MVNNRYCSDNEVTNLGDKILGKNVIDLYKVGKADVKWKRF